MDRFRKMARNSVWRRITALVTSGVLVCSTCGMSFAVNAQKQPDRRLDCQYHVHQHTDACFDEASSLICGQADYVVHVHNQDCYDGDGNLVCSLPEIQPHQHSEACFQNDGTGSLNCPLEESAGHVHDESCYKEVRGDLICPLESGHVHTDDCYAWNKILTCLEEEGEYHTHDDSCYEEEQVLICEEADSHVHTDDCYTWVLEPVCGKEEGEGAHHHDSGCYQGATAPVCGQLELHTHTDACRDADGRIICGKMELLEHVHGEECFAETSSASEEGIKTEESAKPEEGEGETAQGENGTAESATEEGQSGTGESGNGTTESEIGMEATGSGTTESEIETKATESETKVTENGITESESGMEAGESGTTEGETAENESGTEASESGTTESESGTEAGENETTESESETEESESETAESESETEESESEIAESESETEESESETAESENETEESESETAESESETEESETAESETEVSDPNADTETAEDWEHTMTGAVLTGYWAEDVIAIAETQLGYRESTENFVQDEEGNKNGYTRYGAWYGDPYGAWSAMFASFCLSYAQVENFPLEESCESWVQMLSGDAYGYYRTAAEYTPQRGDLLFLDRDADAKADHVGLVAEVSEDAETGAVQLSTIEGDVDGCVQYMRYGLGDAQILGYGELPRQHKETTLSYQGEDYSVQVRFTEEAKIPENAVLDVREVLGEEYEESCRQAKEALGVEELEFARFFDVSFMVDGAEIEPSAPVDVKIAYDQWVGIEEDQIQGAVHFTEEGTEVLNTETSLSQEGSTVFSFTQDSFSVVGVAVGRAMARAAEIPGAPATGAVKGTQVNSLEDGEWYIIYDYADDFNKGYVLRADDPGRSDDAQLTEASMIGGPVEYNGTLDVVWQYVQISPTIGALRNRYGQYLKLQEGRYEDGSVDIYNGKMSLSQNVPTTAEEGIKYDRTTRTLYTGGWGKVNNNKNDNIWNYVFFNGWNSRGCRSAVGGLPIPAERVDKPTFIAKVTSSSVPVTPTPDKPVHPHGAITGNISDAGLTFFNVDGSGGGAEILGGVEYTIYKADGTEYVKCMTGTSSYMVNVGTLPDGTYYIEQTGVPEDQGYVVVPQHKSFTVSNGKAVIGVFYDYKKTGGYESDKTAEVVDYINRTYKVDISAQSGKYNYKLEDQNFQLIVDQSNSMLFPALLTETGNEVTLYGDGSVSTTAWDVHDRKDVEVTGTNSEHLEAAGLSHDQLYYLIADPDNSATVYAIWYDNVSGKWLYQDASYYAKASGDAGEGNNTNDGEEVRFPTHEGAYAFGGGSMDKKLEGTLWGDCRKQDPSNSKKYIPASKRFIIYEGSAFNRLHYLQESMLILINQLAALNSENTMSLITFDKDVKVSDSNNTSTCIEKKLDNAGVEELMGKVNSIKTSGGTRQDYALDHARGEDKFKHSHIKSGKNTIILISDGAPVVSSGDDTPKNQLEGKAKYAADSVKNMIEAENTLITIGLSTTNVKLGHTILEYAASPSNGKTKNGKWFFESDDASILSGILMKNIFTGLTTRKESDTASNIKDVISDSFYPIDPTTNKPLENSTWLTLDGEVVLQSDYRAAGQVKYDEIKKEWYVEWLNQKLPYYDAESGKWLIEWYGSEADVHAKWHGTIYLKAKEDFIGGNVIDTNKSASIVLATDSFIKKGITLETPNVNVRLLDMSQYTAESTVFLGDTIYMDRPGAGGSGDGIPDVIDVMKDFYHQASVEKLVSGAGNTFNKYGKRDADGCRETDFTLSYAIGRDLTPREWETLKAKGKLTLPYTYDQDSSHGAVGYFTIWLSQKGGQGASSQDANWDSADYETQEVGKSVRSYYLNVKYTAYRIKKRSGEDGTALTNKKNGANGPGTEVGSVAGADATLQNGKGEIVRKHTYDVHVIDGKITVQKKMEQAAEKDLKFKFKLTWLGLDEPEKLNAAENAVVQTVPEDTGHPDVQKLLKAAENADAVPYGWITVKAVNTTGTDTEAHLAGQGGAQNETVLKSQDGILSFPHLKRGYYRVEEVGADDDYEAKSATVIANATNCPGAQDGSSAVIFHIGYHPAEGSGAGGADDIVFAKTQTGKHTVYSKPWRELPQSQTDSEEKEYHNESHGAVEILNGLKLDEKKILVEKKWADQSDTQNQHTGDTVYVVLCDKDGKPVITDGKAQVLKLNASTRWKGEFSVTVLRGTTLEYTIREITGISEESGTNRTPAIVVNEKGTEKKTVYFDPNAVVADQDGIEINGKGYIVSYGGTPTNGLTVTNSEAYRLPATGGMGTLLYTISGLLLIGAALMYYISRRRKGAMFR